MTDATILHILAALVLIAIGYSVGRFYQYLANRKYVILGYQEGFAEGQAEPEILMPPDVRARAEEWINQEAIEGRLPDGYYAG
jgi:hypothetical protein